MKIKPTELALKKARNEAARIYAGVKWSVKIKHITGPDLVRIINEAIAETEQKVLVAEIRDEAVKQYQRMLSMVNAVAAHKGEPKLELPGLNGESMSQEKGK